MLSGLGATAGVLHAGRNAHWGGAAGAQQEGAFSVPLRFQTNVSKLCFALQPLLCSTLWSGKFKSCLLACSSQNMRHLWQAITRAIEAQDRLVEEAKTGIVETALGTNEY